MKEGMIVVKGYFNCEQDENESTGGVGVNTLNVSDDGSFYVEYKGKVLCEIKL